MAVKVNVATVWKDTTPWINVGGVWKKCSQVWVNVSGVWKALLKGVVGMPTNGSGGDIAYGNGQAYASWTMGDNGDMWAIGDQTPTGEGPWLSPKVGMSLFACRSTHVSGYNIGGHGVWRNLGISRENAVSISGGGLRSTTFTIEVAEDGIFTVLDTITISLVAQSISGGAP